MEKVTKSQTTKRIIVFIIVNIILLCILYLIPIKKVNIQLCLYKLITGKECFNCGMTRAFLSIMHLNFKEAINFNKNVIIIFPFTLCLYLYSWYNYIICKKGGE